MHLGDHFTDLHNARALLVTNETNLSHDVDHAANGCDHGDRGSAMPLHKLRALFFTRHAGGDDSLISLATSAASSQSQLLAGHHDGLSPTRPRTASTAMSAILQLLSSKLFMTSTTNHSGLPLPKHP
ncbi:hypothetical protein N5D77_21450 [Comamonas thiooxydans]|uniref:hypothetical protein n=1 Tax=Comamonas thiooxydans TaxID=363952 RepID=UPI00244AC08C|nr:hypothetical protein [Comamonas thiooxydans]MDH1742707.1 hypothetical protein [Comamonas thiooxydans]MDH1789146.1 hypothetical protein [Comamonas thiooxydans]